MELCQASVHHLPEAPEIISTALHVGEEESRKPLTGEDADHTGTCLHHPRRLGSRRAGALLGKRVLDCLPAWVFALMIELTLVIAGLDLLLRG